MYSIQCVFFLLDRIANDEYNEYYLDQNMEKWKGTHTLDENPRKLTKEEQKEINP